MVFYQLRIYMTLYLIVPCYNEEECLQDSADKLLKKYEELKAAGKIDDKSKIVLVNDGSKDNTAKIAHSIHEAHSEFSCINFSKNFGHQCAVLAGYMFAIDKCDCAISIDADLQQDINAIDLFLDDFKNGSEIVYGVRNSRDTDGFFKKLTSQMFYKLMQIFGCKIISNHADYRLLSNKALKALAEYKETNVFLRGLIPTLGFKSSIVYFDVFDRTAGKSKYNLSKMMRLAMDGITSFSINPIHYVFYAGVISFIVSIGFMIYTLIDHFLGHTVSGWSTIVISIWLLGGLQLIAIGVIGEYIGKNYIESKRRPRYIIDTVEQE